MNIEKLAWLKDKLQNWPGEMALTYEDIVDLLALLDQHKPAPQPEPIGGKSGCEYVGCQYAARKDGVPVCTHPGDYCIKREDAPDHQPSGVRGELANALSGWKAILIGRELWSEWDERCYQDLQSPPAPTDMETHNNMACVSVQKPAPTDEPYNGPLSGQGVITDEARREMVNDWIETIENYLIEPNEDWWEVLKKDAKEILGVFRALIQSPPKVSVTREWIAEKFLPHRYGGDGYVIEAIAVMLRSLGITVSEAGDSDRPEKGKEGK